MVSNTIKLSLGSLFLIFAISCTNGNHKKIEQSKVSTALKDTCQLDLGAAQNIELGVGCGNCHTYDDKRRYPKLPTYAEISAMDSLKLSNFIFKTRHNGYFLKDTILLNHNNKALDTLDECEKRNLMFFIKSVNRKFPQILKVPKNAT